MGTPSSTTIDQDAPCPCHSPSSSAFQSLSSLQGIAAEPTIMKDNSFAHVDNDPFSKDHPLDNVIGNPSRPVFTKNQLATDALWCFYNSVLSKVEQKNFKSAITKDFWFQAMQDEIHEFDQLQVWELVPRSDYVMIIALKWIYKVKLDEYGDVLKKRLGWWPRDIDKKRVLISRNILHRFPVSRLIESSSPMPPEKNMIIYQMDVHPAKAETQGMINKHHHNTRCQNREN
uniref:Integrase, catalytic region, zinc finger, CCHC-type, peptidase aspartic, catalytic n=1 Tax=Tanacetum cinerariifolium TaxID=118510 RepID=A0A699KB06_TANCI|nr:hypothetical protein [Tanacetum cinerariifolium]